MARSRTLQSALRSGQLRSRSTSKRYSALTILGAGQSNLANWSSSNFHTAGETALLASLSANTGGLTHSFINGADGGSYLSRKAFNAANIRYSNTLQTGDYWVDDTGGSLTAGQRLLDAFAAITSAGKSVADIQYIIWSQGESDAPELQLGNISTSEYSTALVWLKDYCFSHLPNLKRIIIRPIGRRSYGASSFYDAVRSAQQALAAAYPTHVFYGSETYDLPMNQEVYVDDALHRSEAAYSAEATRCAYELLTLDGQLTSNSRGARISSASYNGATIIVTVQQDQGTALTNAVGVAYVGTPLNVTPSAGVGLFTLTDSAGNDVALSSVSITGANEITLTPAVTLLTSGHTLRYGYNHMLGIDKNAIIKDNHPTNPLPLQASYSVAVNGALTYVDGMAHLVSFFTPDASYNTASTASDGIVWSKRAGSGSSARKDDAKPAPTWSTNGGMGLALAGYYFDGSASQKLLVEHALTTSSDYTLCIVATPNHTATDATTATTTNALITTSGVVSTENALFGISQTRTALGSLSLLCAGQGNSASVHNSTTGIFTIRRQGSTVDLWDETGRIATKTITVTPTVESDNSVPVYAIGNVVDKTAGSDPNQAFIGAVHYITLHDVALSDAQVLQLRKALGASCSISVTA